ncbi:MAG: hypothetical protein KatS3mg090_0163 [Patescibacteria group bacterium]|nr:MAG: hypothetical protein KatS3mg090_0163 [Patescibacteria group bacterium]
MTIKSINLNLRHLLIIFLITFLPIVFVLLPFYLKLDQLLFLKLNNKGLINIYQNWDGPNYLIVAKTNYDLEKIRYMLITNTPEAYFTAHLPLYPFLIKIAGVVIPILPIAGLFVNFVFSFLLNLLFFEFIKSKTNHPYFAVFVFTLFPARIFVTRNIIAPEPILMFLTLLSFILSENKRLFKSAIVFSLSVLTKLQNIVLLPAFFLYYVTNDLTHRFKKQNIIKYSFLFIPSATVVLLFYFYYLKTGDFFIYFRVQRLNNLQMSLPFSQFDKTAVWVGNIWLEEIIFYYLIFFLAGIILIKQKNYLYASAILIYTTFLTTLPHNDIIRFSASIIPFVYLAFAKLFDKKEFRLAFILTLPAIYFFTVNFILNNQAGIADWSFLWFSK